MQIGQEVLIREQLGPGWPVKGTVGVVTNVRTGAHTGQTFYDVRPETELENTWPYLSAELYVEPQACSRVCQGCPLMPEVPRGWEGSD